MHRYIGRYISAWIDGWRDRSQIYVKTSSCAHARVLLPVLVRPARARAGPRARGRLFARSRRCARAGGGLLCAASDHVAAAFDEHTEPNVTRMGSEVWGE